MGSEGSDGKRCGYILGQVVRSWLLYWGRREPSCGQFGSQAQDRVVGEYCGVFWLWLAELDWICSPRLETESLACLCLDRKDGQSLLGEKSGDGRQQTTSIENKMKQSRFSGYLLSQPSVLPLDHTSSCMIRQKGLCKSSICHFQKKDPRSFYPWFSDKELFQPSIFYFHTKDFENTYPPFSWRKHRHQRQRWGFQRW